MTEAKLEHDLPEGLIEWVAEIGGGDVTRLDRHVARREAWIVDVTRSDGSVLEGFLRLQREDGGVDPRRLERETRIVEALGRTDVPVPAVHGWNPELRATLFARDAGRADLDRIEDPARQRAVMEDFMRVLARLHRLELDDLGLDDILGARPTTAAACALGEVDLTLSQWSHFLEGYRDPLTRYAVDWLRRFVPKSVARVSLVQGDTGPVNFMFQGDRVSAVIDWELGHYGDPMEDLGNICVREFWNPCGGLEGLFRLYEAESGIPYDRFGAQYYRIQQNVRGMVPIHSVCLHAHPQESLAWYLCYRYVGDRSTAEALAEAMEIAIEPPELPESEGEGDVLADSAIYALEHDVAPALDKPFAASRARDVKALVGCMDRQRRYGARARVDELEDLAALLGRRPGSLEEGYLAFDQRLAEGRLDDVEAIRFLTRKGYRDEWLHAPAAALYPERRWAALD